MPRIPQGIRIAGLCGAQPKGLLAVQSPRRLAARTARRGTPGLIASGPGLSMPRLEKRHWQFSAESRCADGAEFAANLIRAEIAQPEDWVATRNIPKFLNRALCRVVGDRQSKIDYSFDISISLGPTPFNWRNDEEVDPRRILLTFRVVSTVSWVNLAPALEMLRAEHDLLPTIFYHWLDDSLSRWFRVYDVQEARWRWEMWSDAREEDEAERKEECALAGMPYEPACLEEPKLPAYIRTRARRIPVDISTLTRSPKATRLMQAARNLYRISRRAQHPSFDNRDREDLFPDTDPAIPLIALAFGEHDVITELLNMELETAGQVELEPWPIFKMDGTDPGSIRRAFRCARVALDTLEAGSLVLSLVPGFEPLTKHNPFGG